LVPFQENIEKYSKEAIDAAKHAGVKFIVNLSASGADAKQTVYVSREHGLADDYLKQSGIHYSILCPTFFMTNFLWKANEIKAQSITGQAGGDSKFTLVDPDDIADVAAEILLNPDKHKDTSYVLTGEVQTNNEIAKLFTKIIGKEVKYVDSGLDQLEEQLKKNGYPTQIVESLVFLEKVKREGWASQLSDSVHKVLGKQPRTFESWIESNKAAFV